MTIKRLGLVLLIAVSLLAENLGYRVLDSLPHNPNSYTQGLILHDGRLVESTGANGRGTMVIVIDTATGRELHTTEVQQSYFGEGLATDGYVLFQLSWKQGNVYLYGWPNLNPMGTLPYVGQGWGLAYHNKQFYMSSGNDTIQVFNSSFNRITKRVPVTYKENPVSDLNELEFAHEMLFANKWFSDTIFVINPTNGNVQHTVDLSKLSANLPPQKEGGVLNGIAHIADNRFYVTGKLWPWIYEIEIALP